MAGISVGNESIELYRLIVVLERRERRRDVLEGCRDFDLGDEIYAGVCAGSCCEGTDDGDGIHPRNDIVLE